MSTWKGPSGGVVLALPQATKMAFPQCTCGAARMSPTALAISQGFFSYHVAVHMFDCDVFGVSPPNVETLESKPKRLQILLSSGQPWISPAPRNSPQYGHSRKAREATTNYKLVLQFFFHRPINIDLWKRIKAPPGWRKCPTSKDSQTKYYGVRFQCKDLKYSLTPEEVETLRAKLYMSLETQF